MKKNRYIQPSVETMPVQGTALMFPPSVDALNMGGDIDGSDGD